MQCIPILSKFGIHRNSKKIIGRKRNIGLIFAGVNISGNFFTSFGCEKHNFKKENK